MAITPTQQQEILRQKTALNDVERSWALQIEHKIDALLVTQTEIKVQDVQGYPPRGAQWGKVLADIVVRYERAGWSIIPAPLVEGVTPVILTFIPKPA